VYVVRIERDVQPQRTKASGPGLDRRLHGACTICTVMEAAIGMPYWLAALARAASADFSCWNIAFVHDEPSLLKSSKANQVRILPYCAPCQKPIQHPCCRSSPARQVRSL
jgi:hypothetical protein